MHEGAVVQIGSPQELFERPGAHLCRPLHRLAGHERAALPGRRRHGPSAASPSRWPAAAAAGRRSRSASGPNSSGSPPASGFRSACARRGRRPPPHRRGASSHVRINVLVTDGGRVAGEGAGSVRSGRTSTSMPTAGWWSDDVTHKTENQWGGSYVLPVFVLVAFNGRDPADGGGELFDAGDVRQQCLLLRRREVVRAGAALGSAFHASLMRQLTFTGIILAIEVPLGVRSRSPCRGAARGLGLPGADGAAAVDPMERRRRDVEHLRAAGHRHARPHAQPAGVELQLHPAAARGLGDADRHGRLALDLAWWCCSPMRA